MTETLLPTLLRHSRSLSLAATCVFFAICLTKTDSLLFYAITSVTIGIIYYYIDTHPQTRFFIKYFFDKKPSEQQEPTLIKNGNKYILTYFHGKKKHVFVFDEAARSNDLIIFKDEFNKDITDEIEPFLGPLQNFHGVLYKPNDFGHKKINVFRDGVINFSKTFDENDHIKLN